MSTRYTQDTRALSELFGLSLSEIAIAMATSRDNRYPIGTSGSVFSVRTTAHPSTPPLLLITVEGTTGIETIGFVCPIPAGADADPEPSAVLAATCERYGDPLELRSNGTVVAEGRLIRDVTFPGQFDVTRDVVRPDTGSTACVIRAPSETGDTLIPLLFYLRAEELAKDLHHRKDS